MYFYDRESKDFNEEMIVWLAGFNFIASFWFGLGQLPGNYGDGFCITQGFSIQTFALGSVLFNVCVGFNLYR